MVMFRYKTIFGESLDARIMENQRTILLLAYYKKVLFLCPHFLENYTIATPLFFPSVFSFV
ncbi:hypothetical protein Barb7_02932 [Bacteroidales bacterium Barb7]|nr:hypothetical protein Barb7_02932 [Bacteroidales bacterium Barb7]